jgi:hypothetical protein
VSRYKYCNHPARVRQELGPHSNTSPNSRRSLAAPGRKLQTPTAPVTPACKSMKCVSHSPKFELSEPNCNAEGTSIIKED